MVKKIVGGERVENKTLWRVAMMVVDDLTAPCTNQRGASQSNFSSTNTQKKTKKKVSKVRAETLVLEKPITDHQ